MKKILLQKGRDEVCAASLRATPQPTRDPAAPPLTDRSTTSSPHHKTTSPHHHDDQHQHQSRMPSSSSIEHSQIAGRTSSSSSSRVSTPSSNHHHHPPPHHPPSEFPALLPAVTSLPVPLLMLPLPSRTGVGGGAPTLDKFYLGESNRVGAFSLPPPPHHAYPGFFQLGGDVVRFPGVVGPSSRLLQYGKSPTDDEVSDFQVLRQESHYGRSLGNALAVPLRSAETVARMRKSVELRFDESREYGRASLPGMVSVETMRRDVVAMETMRREVAMETMRRDVAAMETMRRDVAMEMVTSSNIVEAKNGGDSSVMEVDVEEEEEDDRRRMVRSRSMARSLEDLVEEEEVPRMIDKREMSPMERTDTDSKTVASPRSDIHESFKSPASSGHHPKSVYRPKGRPTKAAAATGAGEGGGGGGQGGPGGVRSIIRCPVCAKQFNNSSALAKHKLTHSDERKYACTLCNKAFKRQDHLNGHMMTHSSMKPFACKFIGCNKSYCDARSLRRHMENHHQECSSNSTTTTTTGVAGGGGSALGFFNYDGSSYQPGYGGAEGGGGGASDGGLSYLQQVSPISPVAGGLRGASSTQSSSVVAASRQFGGGGGGGGMAPQGQMWVTGYNPLDEPKPVKCHVCGRGFKNIPALNGHMRLHGGYVRKDLENVDESQDVSRSSDARTESQFSQSENSLSSASVNDHRQHESAFPGLSFATTSQLKGLETGRRHFFLGSTSAEAEVGRGGPEKLVAVEREEARTHAADMRSCVEEARSRDGDMRSRDGDMRSLEEMMRSRAEEQRSRTEEMIRSRAEEQRSRAEEMRSRNEDTRSRVEEPRSRAEDARSQAEKTKGHAEEFREHALYARFGLLDRCVGARTAGGSGELFRVRDSVPMLDASREFEGTHGRRYGDSDQPAGVKCSSPRKGKKQDDEFPKDFTVRSRLLDEDRPPIVQIMRLAGHQMSSGVDKLLGYAADYSNAFECDKAKSEIRCQFGPVSAGVSHAYQPPSPGKPPRKVRGAEEVAMPPLVAVSPAKPTAAVEIVSTRAGGGAEFPSAVGGPPRHHSKAGSTHRIGCAETTLQRRGGKTREEKVSVLSGERREECVPDSTSGRDDVGVTAEKKMWNVKSEDGHKFAAGTPPHAEGTYMELDIPKGEESDMRRLVGESTPEGFRGANSSPPCAVTSPSTRQSACLYRQRWMNLQLKQSGGQQTCSEIPGDSHVGSDCGGGAASTYGTGTDCGDPSTPKPNHKIPRETGAHPLSEPSRHVRNAEPGSCLSGNSAPGCPPHRSSPTSPAFQAASPLTWKRGVSIGGLPTFSYPPTTIDVGTATLQSCHNGLTPREGLHHVHSNGCLTHTATADPNNSYVQSHIPCSPYDPRPHTPCAAHTPFTPCQPYTPHTPYTPCAANRQSTPKHASHFEFPPRVCLQESSQCDSPYPLSGQAAQMMNPGQTVEIRLAVEPEYHPLEKFNMETELLRQHGYSDRRDSIGATDFEIDRPRKHLQTTESDNRLNLLWQRDFDRQKQQQLHTGTGHPRLQNEAWNPDDGFSASLPTGAKRNSPGLAYNNSTIEKPEKAERKRKLSEDLAVSVETKRSVVLMESRNNSTETTGRDSRDLVEPVSSSCGAQNFKTEAEEERRKKAEEEMEVDPSCKESYAGEKTVFRNPPSPLKVKKSRPRPEPLFIPPNVNHFGFQSRLRSPRLWDGLTKQMAPPYTPPPMLSPARSGSGLFWKLHSGFHSPVTGPPVLPKYDKVKCPIISWPEETPPPTAEERQPPETDLQPHINIGPQYQPDLPQFRGSKPHGQDRTGYDDHSTLVWTPSTAAKLNEEEVTQYLQYACCAIIPGNGSNQEYAMHLLHLSRGDMKKAVKLLLESEPRLPRSSGLKTYKYQDCVKWKRAEIDLFHKSIMKLDKDFFQISKLVGSKSVKDCVQFYYLWKKICPDELKQLKVVRRKREQYELYNRRSKDLRSGGGGQAQKSTHEKSNNVSRGSKKHEQMDSLDFQYQDLTGKPLALKEELMEDSDAEKRWCSICKRSFTSVRNFAAHVKMHERSRMRREQTEVDGGAKQLPYSKQMGSSGF